MAPASALVRVLPLAGGGEMDDLIDVRPLQGIADEAKTHQLPQLLRELILHAQSSSERSHQNGFGTSFLGLGLGWNEVIKMGTAIITSVVRFG